MKGEEPFCVVARRTLGFCYGDFFDLSNELQDFHHKGGLVPFAAMRNGSQIRCVRFDHEFLKRTMPDGAPDNFGIRIRCDACKGEEISFAYETFYVFPLLRAAVEDQGLRFHFRNNTPDIVDRFPTMHDDGHLEFLCDLQLRLENFALRIAWGKIVMVIEPDLADRAYFWMTARERS